MSAFAAFRTVALTVFKSNAVPCARLPQIGHYYASLHTAYARKNAIQQAGKPKRQNNSSNTRSNRKDKDKEIILKPPEKKRPKNEKIKHKFVHVLDPQTGRTSGPQALSDLLASVDLDAGFVELVSEAPWPTVRVVTPDDLREEHRKKVASRERAKVSARRNTQKEVQVRWGADEGDWLRKLEQLRAELDEGYRVDLVLVFKRSQLRRRLDPSEIEQRFDEVIASMEGRVKEYKPRDINQARAVVGLQSVERPEVSVSEDIPKRKLLQMMRREQEEKRLRKRQELSKQPTPSMAEDGLSEH